MSLYSLYLHWRVYSAGVSLMDRRLMAFQVLASRGRTFTSCSPGCLTSILPRSRVRKSAHPLACEALPVRANAEF